MRLALILALLPMWIAFTQSIATDFTADVRMLLTSNSTGIYNGRFYYSYGQGAYRFTATSYSELYTYFVPVPARPARRWSCSGYGFGCLDNQTITTTVFSNKDSQGNDVYTIGYEFNPIAKWGCAVGKILLNVPPPCVDVSKISLAVGPDSHCQAKLELKPNFWWPYCRYFEGIRYPDGAVRVSITSTKYGVTCNQLNVTIPGALPGDGMLGLVDSSNFRCGSVQSTVFVCTHVNTPQIKFTNSSSCKCEVGAPIFGGAPVLFKDLTTYSPVNSSSISGCDQYNRKPTVPGPVQTLWLNTTTGLPCSASFTDGRLYNFTNINTATVPSSVFAKPTELCNCTTPLDVSLVLDQTCSFYDFDMLRFFATELVMNFQISSRYTRFSVFRAHYNVFQALKLTKGLTVLNILSAIKSLGCCGTWRSDNDDDNYCCSVGGGVSQSIKQAADELASRDRNYSTPAIVVLSSKLSDPGIPSALNYTHNKDPNIVVYFITTRYDNSWQASSNLINDDVFTQVSSLGNTTNYRVWSRTDWLFWRRLRLMLVGAICSQNPFPCGQNCCAQCVCTQPISPDSCLQPPTDSCSSVQPVKGCCTNVPVCTSTDPCVTQYCSGNQCLSKSVCPDSNQCYNYSCNATARQCVQTPSEYFMALQQDAASNQKNCTRAICTPTGPTTEVTQVCSVNDDACGLTTTSCVQGQCVSTVHNVSNGCITYSCIGTTLISNVKRCDSGPLAQFMKPTTNVSGTVFPVCDPSEGVCKAIPVSCGFCTTLINGNCAPILPLNTVCPYKKDFVPFQCNDNTGTCSYLPFICPSTSCDDPDTILPFQDPTTNTFKCNTTAGVDVGTVFNPTSDYVQMCRDKPGCSNMRENPLADCSKQVQQCVNVGFGSYDLQPVAVGNGDICKAIQAKDPCVSVGTCIGGSCVLQPFDCAPFIATQSDDACQVARCSIDTQFPDNRSCQLVNKNCTGQNKCFTYSCAPNYGCVGTEKCKPDLCYNYQCQSALTGVCQPLDPIIPAAFDSPCWIAHTCNLTTGWTFSNYCDDNNSATIDVCHPGTTPTCSYVCSNNDPCFIEVYNSITRQCDKTPINCTSHIGGVDEGTITSSLLAAIDCDDHDACTIGYLQANNTCTFTPIDCSDSDPCTIDSCDPFLGCVHLQMFCTDTSSQVEENKCSISSCQPTVDSDGNPKGVCVTQQLTCLSSVRVEVVVGTALSAAAILGIAAACVAIFLCTGTGAYYVKLNLQPEEEADTNWNALYETAKQGEGARRGGANPIHKRH